jgi:hypothetical protein
MSTCTCAAAGVIFKCSVSASTSAGGRNTEVRTTSGVRRGRFADGPDDRQIDCLTAAEQVAQRTRPLRVRLDGENPAAGAASWRFERKGRHATL